MMRSVLILLGAACLAVLSLPASAQGNRQQPEQIVPNQTPIAVYMPPSALRARFYSNTLWVEPGKALSDAVDEVGKRYFPNLVLVPSDGESAYALIVDLAPDWDAARGKVQLKMQYGVYDVDGKKLMGGNTEQAVPLKSGNLNAAADAASALAIRHVMVEIQRRLNPDAARHPASGSTADIDFGTLVDREKPYRTGTAFFINTAGSLLTAAHVARDCVVIEAHQDGTTFPVTSKASSDLLDIAVLETGQARDSALSLRSGNQIVLGEAVTSVGFPLKGLLGDSPNVTRGNVSASRGIRGSMGMFQFSAPIQPGNSGGPIVSDNGELLGMAVSTLNAGRLAQRGLIPQNVNFALDGRYVAKFLQREGVPFDEIAPEGVGGLQVANQAALGNTVQLNCYE
ncbi:MAG: serine protease [Luteimonas sp.]|nr:serine protease [Luteimonas sp.]